MNKYNLYLGRTSDGYELAPTKDYLLSMGITDTREIILETELDLQKVYTVYSDDGDVWRTSHALPSSMTGSYGSKLPRIPTPPFNVVVLPDTDGRLYFTFPNSDIKCYAEHAVPVGPVRVTAIAKRYGEYFFHAREAFYSHISEEALVEFIRKNKMYNAVFQRCTSEIIAFSYSGSFKDAIALDKEIVYLPELDAWSDRVQFTGDKVLARDIVCEHLYDLPYQAVRSAMYTLVYEPNHYTILCQSVSPLTHRAANLNLLELRASDNIPYFHVNISALDEAVFHFSKQELYDLAAEVSKLNRDADKVFNSNYRR